MAKFEVKSVNISTEKGTVKNPVDSITINEKGVKDDAHAGDWHRQVSLLGTESYAKMTAGNDLNLNHGVFAENITTEGLILHNCNVFDRFVGKQVVLEVTQIGKKCHKGCEIFKKVGDCVMPREGIFCRVVQGGELRSGDEFDYKPRIVKLHIITLSDRAHKGIYEDKSGPYAAKLMREFFEGNNRKTDVKTTILPDDAKLLKEELLKSAHQRYDVVVTTGGTGIGKRDFTPEVVKGVIDKEIPGIMEHIRLKYGADAPNALISRSVAGVIDSTLVYAIPGSVKAVKEYLSEINKTMEHSFRMLNSIDSH